jgi:hypothetical protein
MGSGRYSHHRASRRCVIEVGFGLKVQLLGSFNERVLVVGQLAGFRAGDGWFRPRDVDRLFEQLRVHGGNVSRALQLLDAQKFVLNSSSRKAWSLTPLGEEKALELVGGISPEELAPKLLTLPGAEFGHEVHTLIPPSLAPQKWAGGIARMLKEHPFESNVFLMARFPQDADDPNHGVIEAAREVLAGHGYTLHVASDLTLDEDLWGNVAAHMWACQYGLGLFENRSAEGLNYNLLIEVGSMVSIGRRCMLLKDRTADAMPTDLVGHIYNAVDFDKTDDVSRAVDEWATNALRLDQ